MLKKIIPNTIKKRIAEFRTLADNEKALIEQRADLTNEMDSILNKCKEETRAFNTEEDTRFNEIKKEIESIDNTLNAMNEKRALDNKAPKNVNKEQRAIDEENFANFIRGEKRALDVATNGGIIPTTISNRIIEKVKELSPIYSLTTIHNVNGDLVFPVYDEGTSSIGANYSEDMSELTEGTGKFTTITLENYIIGCLAKISKSLINRTDFDLVAFVINKVAQAIADFLEKELIKGTPGKIQGLSSNSNLTVTASATAITTDELIDVQMSVPEVYQKNACWIMHKNTLKALRKLKDADGNYILGTTLNGFGYVLLGKPVHITESADEIAAGKTTVFYGDMSGLYVKLSKGLEIQVLIEKYATQHALGVVAYTECDGKIVEKQKISGIKMKAV